MISFPMEETKMKTPNLIGRACVLCLGAAMASDAANYYVSTQGNDGNPGTISAPWKTLFKVSTAPLKAGDSVLLERTGVWRETLTLPASGTATAPIVVAPYGTGTTKPEIRGSLDFTSDMVDGLRTANVPAGSKVKAVYNGNNLVPVSRYPESGWLTATKIENDTTLLVSGGLESTDWTGASIHLRTSMWTLETHYVKSGAAGRIVMSTKLISIPSRVQFYFTNHRAGMSTTKATWYQSPSDNVLRWSDPTGAYSAIDAAVRNIAVDLKSRSYIVLRGLRIIGAAKHGIYSTGAGVQVVDCAFRMPGLVAAQLDGARIQFLNNWIVGAGNSAVIGHGLAPRIEANNIRQTAQMDLLGPDGMGDGCCGGHGIAMNGDSALIKGNDIDLTGYNGITFVGKYTQVRENIVARSCTTTDDCAGIYTIAGKYENPGPTGSVIRRNVVKDAVGSNAGWSQHYPASQGIYLDDGSHDILVDSNVTTGNAASGLFLHNTQRVVARDNFIAGNKAMQVQFQHDAIAGPGHMMDNVMERNTMVSLPDQELTKISINQAQPMAPATWVGNLECSDTRVQVTCRKDGKAYWSQKRISDTTSLLGTETQKPTAPGNWGTSPSTVYLVREPQAQISGSTTTSVLKLVDSTKKGATLSGTQQFSVAVGDNWLVRFRAKGTKVGQILYPVIRRSFGDYMNLGTLPTTYLDTVWTEYVYLFKATGTEAKARIDIHSGDSLYWIEGISVRSLAKSALENLPGSQVYVNAATKPTIGYLQGTWFDTDGKGVSTLNVGALSGRVVFQMEKPRQTAQILEHAPAARIVRKAGGILIEGARHPVAIRDIRGTLRARIVPDAQGNAYWPGASGNGPLWAVVDGKTLALPVMVR